MASFRPRSLTEYLQILWRRKGLIFFVTAAMLIATYLVIAGIPDIYESRAAIVVAVQHENKQAVAARVATVTETLVSRAFLEPLIQRHNLYPGAIQSGVMDGAVAHLRSRIKIDAKWRADRPETIAVSYRHKDPAVAQAVAAELTAAFGQVNDAIEKQLVQEDEAIRSEMAAIESQMDQLGQRRSAAAARRSAMSHVASSINEIQRERAAASMSLEALGDKQYALEQQIAEQKRQIAEQEKIAATAIGDARSSGSYGVLAVRKAELEAQLKDYSTQYTDKHPKVIQARTQLAEINRQIAQLSAGNPGGAPANSSEARELRAMQRELSRLQTELEITRREIARKQKVAGGAPGAGRRPIIAATSGEDEGTKGEYDRLKERYEVLVNRQESLRKLQITTAGLDAPLFQIIDTPVQAQLPAGPNRLKLQLIGLALALGLGLAAAVVVEAPRLFSIRDDRDVEYYLGTRVLALIPETLTPAERGRMRRLMLTRGLGVLLLGLALVPAFFYLLNFSSIFQIIANR